MADDLDSLLREIEGALSGAEDISSASSTKTSENKTHQVTTFSFRSIDSRSNSTHSYENSFKKNQVVILSKKNKNKSVDISRTNFV